MRLLFLPVLLTATSAWAFHPEQVSRNIESSLLFELSQARSAAKYREIDSLSQTNRSLILSCRIELKEERVPKNCFDLLALQERLTHRSSLADREELRKLEERTRRHHTIQDYIKRRKQEVLGIESE